MHTRSRGRGRGKGREPLLPLLVVILGMKGMGGAGRVPSYASLYLVSILDSTPQLLRLLQRLRWRPVGLAGVLFLEGDGGEARVLCGGGGQSGT